VGREGSEGRELVEGKHSRDLGRHLRVAPLSRYCVSQAFLKAAQLYSGQSKRAGCGFSRGW
jgi:hypothetical protein